jgi:hypothetical protein
MELVFALIFSACIGVASRFILFTDSYDFRWSKSNKKQSGRTTKRQENKANKTARLEQMLKDANLGMTVKKFRMLSITSGIITGIFTIVMTGWIIGFIPGYLIGIGFPRMIASKPLKHRAMLWEEQILLFAQNMSSSIQLNNGSMSVSITQSVASIENPAREEFYNILAAYNNSQIPLEEGFNNLYKKTGIVSFRLIGDAIKTASEIGLTASQRSFEQIYKIVKSERSNRVKRETMLQPYSIFVKIFLTGAFLAPPIQFLFNHGDYTSATNGLIGKIGITVGYLVILLMNFIISRLESTNDISIGK